MKPEELFPTVCHVEKFEHKSTDYERELIRIAYLHKSYETTGRKDMETLRQMDELCIDRARKVLRKHGVSWKNY